MTATPAYVRAILELLAKEVERNPKLAAAITDILEQRDVAQLNNSISEQAPKRKSHRRTPAPFDPLLVRQQGEEELRTRLESLSIDQLKDIIAEFGMDRAKLAMKWRTKDRLVEFIMSTVAQRSQKGDAFRTP